MFSISYFLFVCVTATFADTLFPNTNEGNSSFVPQQVPQQSDQFYSSSAPQLFMQGNQNSFPIPQQAMMQGFQSPFMFNPLNQQQLSLLMMSTYARMMTLAQMMTMQNRYQPFNQYNDPAMNNFGQIPVPLPYVQQPQAETQNNFQNEMLQQQQHQADSQQQAILEERINHKYNMEVQRHHELLKRKAEEEKLEQRQKLIERQLRDEQEIEREKREAERQILEEEREEQEKKENDRKLREKEELRSKLIEEEKLKQMQGIKSNMRPLRGVRKPCKSKVQPEK